MIPNIEEYYESFRKFNQNQKMKKKKKRYVQENFNYRNYNYKNVVFLFNTIYPKSKYAQHG